MDLADMYITLHKTRAVQTSFSSTYGTLSRTNHMLGHKIHLSKFETIEIMESMF